LPRARQHRAERGHQLVEDARLVRAARSLTTSGALMSRALDSSTVATSRMPFILSVEPVDVRSTTMSAMPRCGAISAAPTPAPRPPGSPASAKKRRVTRGKTVATRGTLASLPETTRPTRVPLATRPAITRRCRRPTGSALLARRHHEPAAAEAEVEQHVERAARSRHEIPPRHARVGRTVGHELGDVLRAHEDGLELAAERRGERALAAGANLEAGVVEQLAGLLGETSLVGQSDAEHAEVVGGVGWRPCAAAPQLAMPGKRKARPVGTGRGGVAACCRQ
jgi:hypothetical protein